MSLLLFPFPHRRRGIRARLSQLCRDCGLDIASIHKFSHAVKKYSTAFVNNRWRPVVSLIAFAVACFVQYVYTN